MQINQERGVSLCCNASQIRWTKGFPYDKSILRLGWSCNTTTTEKTRITTDNERSSGNLNELKHLVICELIRAVYSLDECQGGSDELVCSVKQQGWPVEQERKSWSLCLFGLQLCSSCGWSSAPPLLRKCCKMADSGFSNNTSSI